MTDVDELTSALRSYAGRCTPPPVAGVRARARRVRRRRAAMRAALASVALVGGGALVALAVAPVGDGPRATVATTQPPAAEASPELGGVGGPVAARALLDAVRDDDHAEIARLLAAGANPNASERYGITPLMVAAIRGDARSTAALLDAHAYVGSSDGYGRSALAHAARGGSAEVVELLLDAGADPSARLLEYEQRTPLMLAAAAGHVSVLEALVAAGGDPDAVDREGRSVVHHALNARDAAAVVSELVRLGADVERLGAGPADDAAHLVELLRRTDPGARP